MTIQIDQLPTTVLPSAEHTFPAMRDGLSVQLAVQQVIDLTRSVILGGATPAELDTFLELAAAIGNDANFAGSMANALAARVRIDAGQAFTPAQQKQGQDNLGAFGRTVDTTAVNYAVVAADNGKVITVDASGAARTVTLPAAAGLANGFKVIIKKVDATLNAVTIDPAGSETIDGALTRALRLPQQSVALICNGVSWRVISDGSIFESGSNVNGEYLRFADGVQICTYRTIQYTIAANDTHVLAGLTHAAAFSAIPTSLGTTEGFEASAARLVNSGVHTVTTTGYGLSGFHLASGTRDYRYVVLSYGRWY